MKSCKSERRLSLGAVRVADARASTAASTRRPNVVVGSVEVATRRLCRFVRIIGLRGAVEGGNDSPGERGPNRFEEYRLGDAAPLAIDLAPVILWSRSSMRPANSANLRRIVDNVPAVSEGSLVAVERVFAASIVGGTVRVSTAESPAVCVAGVVSFDRTMAECVGPIVDSLSTRADSEDISSSD